MADVAQATMTVSPAVEPILDPPVPLVEQFEKVVLDVFMRPPLKRDGTEISGAAELDQAVKPQEETWQSSGCHPACITMILRWYAGLNPETKGKVSIPNRSAEEAELEITPLRVAKWLWDPSGDATPNKTFESASDHPPWVPHERNANNRWDVAHKALVASLAEVKLVRDGNPEPMTVETAGWPDYSPDGIRKLEATIAALNRRIDDLESEIAQSSGARKKNLEAKKIALEKQRDQAQTRLDAIPMGKDGQPDAEWLTKNRQQKKAKLKNALLRGPVALNMVMPGHFILLYGYRERNMVLCDPGLILKRQWVNTQDDKTGFTSLGNSGDHWLFDGERECDLPLRAPRTGEPPTARAAFLDCLIYYECYHFKSCGKHPQWSSTPIPISIPNR